MPASDAPDYESMAARLESSGHYRVLRRLRPGQSVRPGTGKMRRAVFIDVETTGLEFGTDEIIEIGLVPFEYDSEGQVTRILAPYQSFQEPSISIPQEISALTGITDAMVSGKVIDLDAIRSILDSAVLVWAYSLWQSAMT